MWAASHVVVNVDDSAASPLLACPESTVAHFHHARTRRTLEVCRRRVDTSRMRRLAIPLFRAESASRFRSGTAQTRREGVRLPVNVPYVVDNLWEHLRPRAMPSRRHAVYASPTPQQALGSGTKDDLVVGELWFAGEVKLAQLQVADAKDHPDIRAIGKAMQGWIDAFAAAGGERADLAPLFVPGSGKADWAAAIEASPAVAALVTRMTEASTFWVSASATPRANGGETFFEPLPGASYTLLPPPAGAFAPAP